MASIGKDKNGRRRILFVAPDGKRKTIRLGKMPQRAAEAIKVKVENLVGAAVSGCGWDNETARWVADLPDTLADKLAAVDLIPKRKKETPTDTLGAFLDAYIEGRSNLKPNTKRNYEVTRKHLINHFGRERLLAEITPGEADEWLEALREKLSAATVSREVKRARQFFRAALRKRLIAENPFTDLSTPAQVNASRAYFITTAIIEKVIEACPDAEWRLIVTLSRYGGLRCPSEHLSLKWGDVDWEHNRVTIRSPKTEHHAGGESRVIPLFPELRPHLETLFFDEERVGTEHIITRYRDRNANLRTQLLRIIDRAGVKPWPKLFHNLRASRQTELTDRFPLHVVCEWIGNSAPIADKHYLQVTDDHYADAVTTNTPEGRGTESGTVNAESGTEAAQFPAQQSAAQSRTDSQETNKARENWAVLLPSALACDSMLGNRAPPRGVEPLSSD
jgi:integrase